MASLDFFRNHFLAHFHKECKEQEEEHCSGSQIHLAQCLISSNHQQKMPMETSVQVTQSDTALVHASSPATCASEASRAKGGGFEKTMTLP